MKDLCRTIPDPGMAATALEALFDSDPAAAAEIAEKRLAQSLAHDCVPAPLVKLLSEKRLDPFHPLADRLDAVGCERQRLRPARPLFPAGGEAKDVRLEARAAAERMSGTCQKAFQELIGIDKEDEKEEAQGELPAPQ